MKFNKLIKKIFESCSRLPKGRVNKDGLMGSASRAHRRKNKTLPRKRKHKKPTDDE